jgi:hypothetical protein
MLFPDFLFFIPPAKFQQSTMLSFTQLKHRSFSAVVLQALMGSCCTLSSPNSHITPVLWKSVYIPLPVFPDDDL